MGGAGPGRDAAGGAVDGTLTLVALTEECFNRPGAVTAKCFVSTDRLPGLAMRIYGEGGRRK